LGRRIRGGRYFVKDKPLDKTDFAKDPEYAAKTAEVLEILGKARFYETAALAEPQAIRPGVIAVGDAASKEDLLSWAGEVDEKTLPAGGSDFFAAMLETKGFSLRPKGEGFKAPADKTAFFVCTGSSGYTRSALEKARIFKIPIAEMPARLFETEVSGEGLLEVWMTKTADALKASRVAVVAVNRPVSPSRSLARRLCRDTADMICNLLESTCVEEFYIEGGATAAAILERLNWRRFFALDELAPGVIRMGVQENPAVHVTVKPGSYVWPEQIWTPA
jgi:uncharacterized protein YgbK (DUF1537 family)